MFFKPAVFVLIRFVFVWHSCVAPGHVNSEGERVLVATARRHTRFQFATPGTLAVESPALNGWVAVGEMSVFGCGHPRLLTLLINVTGWLGS